MKVEEEEEEEEEEEGLPYYFISKPGDILLSDGKYGDTIVGIEWPTWPPDKSAFISIPSSLSYAKAIDLGLLVNQTQHFVGVDASRIDRLDHIYTDGAPLTELVLGSQPQLTTLSCPSGKLTNLDISGCTALEYLFCSNNQLTTLDISQCPNLVEISCEGNDFDAAILEKLRKWGEEPGHTLTL